MGAHQDLRGMEKILSINVEYGLGFRLYGYRLDRLNLRRNRFTENCDEFAVTHIPSHVLCSCLN